MVLIMAVAVEEVLETFVQHLERVVLAVALQEVLMELEEQMQQQTLVVAQEQVELVEMAARAWSLFAGRWLREVNNGILGRD
jgi:maleate cis-trans isomerase